MSIAGKKRKDNPTGVGEMPHHLHRGKLNGKNEVSDYPQQYDGPNIEWQNPSARRHMIICM